MAFLKVARAARWRHLADIRKTYRHADAVVVESRRTVIVINIKGNQYRLVVAVHHNAQRLFVLRFMPHDEYSTGRWKKSL